MLKFNIGVVFLESMVAKFDVGGAYSCGRNVARVPSGFEQVRLPFAPIAVANCPTVVQSVGFAARLVAVAARSMVMLFGTSASAIAAQLRFPFAAMTLANWFAAQSAGLEVKALAVKALPEESPRAK